MEIELCFMNVSDLFDVFFFSILEYAGSWTWIVVGVLLGLAVLALLIAIPIEMNKKTRPPPGAGQQVTRNGGSVQQQTNPVFDPGNVSGSGVGIVYPPNGTITGLPTYEEIQEADSRQSGAPVTNGACAVDTESLPPAYEEIERTNGTVSLDTSACVTPEVTDEQPSWLGISFSSNLGENPSRQPATHSEQRVPESPV